MIQEKQKLSGTLNSKQSLNGSLSNSVIYVDPITQEKIVIPTAEQQIVTPDKEYTGLSKVTVKGYVPNVASKTVTSNGTYKASDDNLDGYSEVTVETSGVDINEYFDSTIIGGTYTDPGWKQNIKKWRSPLIVNEGTSTDYMFRDFIFDETVLPEVIFPSNEISLYQMFYNATKIKEIPWLKNITAKAKMSGAFQSCSSLVKLNKINCKNVTNIINAFDGAYNLTDFEGLENLGEAYLTTTSANNQGYRLSLTSCTLLTEQSLINVLNNLYDIATKGCKVQSVILGSTNLAKLTSEEGQTALTNATAKGWSVS